MFIAVDGIHQLTTTKLSTGELDDLIERMLRTSGRRVDLSQPFVDAAVASGANILVSGATQAGKTTMLNALAGSIPARERTISCEEVFELNLPSRDWVPMQCRQPSLEGTNEQR